MNSWDGLEAMVVVEPGGRAKALGGEAPCALSNVVQTADDSLLVSVVCDENEVFGHVLSLSAPAVPLVIDICFDGISFCTLRCTGAVSARQVLNECIGMSMPPTALSGLTDAMRISTTVPGGFRYAIPAYIPRNRAYTLVVREVARNVQLFEASIRLDGRAAAALDRVFAGVPSVRFSGTSLSSKALGFTAHLGGHGGDLEPRPVTDHAHLRVSATVSRLSTAVSGDRVFAGRAPTWVVRGQVALDDWDGKAFAIRLQDVASGRLLGAYSSALFVPESCTDDYATWRIPDLDRQARVMGFGDPLAYYLGGFATFKTLDFALRQTIGRGLSSFASILDWGAGCGRLTQHLLQRTRSEVRGIDIDADNVAWSNAHLADGVFGLTPLMPPSGIDASTFELIVGISIFTHLDEQAQFAWLAELHRCLQPGGVAVVTVISSHGLAQDPHPLERYWELQRRGIDDSIIGNTLDAVLAAGDLGYYRETAHAHHYILQHWREWFDVLAIYTGAHFDLQDICVLRRRERVQPNVGPLLG